MKCPLALFAYRRPEHLQRVVESLQANPESLETDLFIYSDAAKTIDAQPGVEAVRSYVRTIYGFRTITIIEREKNYGLSRSITEGVTALCEKYGRVAVVEDDVVVSRYFLSWLNRALDKYEFDNRVMSIGCYVFPNESVLPATFFLNITDCWGWAVWKRSWDIYEPDGEKLLYQLMQRRLGQRFDLEGAYPYTDMLREQIAGRNDSWAVRWYASAVLSGGLTIYPGKSMTMNIGFDGSGAHCGTEKAYKVDLAQHDIAVNDIPVEESPELRRIWSEFLRRTSQTNPISSQLSRVLRWAGSFTR